MLRRLYESLPRWHRAVRRRRRPLSVLLVALLAAVVLPGLLPASAEVRTVLVAAADLPQGTVLSEGDLRPVEVAGSLVPAGSTDSPGDLEGIRLGADALEGEPLSPERLRASARDPVLDGLAVLVVPIEPALLPRLAAGDELSLVVSTAAPGTTRRISAIVVEVPASPALEGPSTIGGAASTDVSEVLVAVDPSLTGDVAHAVREGWIQAALVF